MNTSMISVIIRFYEELNFFLPPVKRKAEIHTSFATTRSVKDLVESYGVPHVEVDLILVNGRSVGFDHQVANGDRISVYPVFERLDIQGVTRLRPLPLRDTRFIADVHLKTLVRRLRMLGFDTLHDPAWDDKELADISAREERILLTRDRRLLMRSIVTRGLYIRNTDPERQIREVVDRLDLRGTVRPFSRCIVCNGGISPVPRGSMEKRLVKDVPEGVRAWCDEYYRCRRCEKVYWKGSHYRRMLERIAGL